MTRQQKIREGLAEIEHEQWWHWAKSLTPELNDILYKLPEGSLEADRLATRLARWSLLFKPYTELTEEQKDQDREWADKSLVELHSQGARLKVERELPNCPYHRFVEPECPYELSQQDMLKAGYVAVESIIKEESNG